MCDVKLNTHQNSTFSYSGTSVTQLKYRIKVQYIAVMVT